MKLSRLYAHDDNSFKPIVFNDGLNVILAEIRLPENQGCDAHNLGKSTVGSVIDYCLLAGASKDDFFAKNPDIFKDFVFYLEVKLGDGQYVTIRRPAVSAGKISVTKHEQSCDLRQLSEDAWDHVDLPFERAKILVGGILALDVLKEWGYRRGLGYVLRGQGDYGDVFQLSRFHGPHSQWKPMLAGILGFDSRLVRDHYAAQAHIKKLKDREEGIQEELGRRADDLARVDGLLFYKKIAAESKSKFLESFDFSFEDQLKTEKIVSQLDEEIAELNRERYTLKYNERKIATALAHGEINFDPEVAQELFKEVGIFFDGQLKRDYVQLIDFARAISRERAAYLREEDAEIKARLKEIASTLDELGQQRSQMLSFISDTDAINKYKTASAELVQLQAQVQVLEKQRDELVKLQDLRAKVRVAEQEKVSIESRLADEFTATTLAHGEGIYASIRASFGDIIQAVVDRPALLTVSLNSHVNPEFSAEIVNDDHASTSAGKGHSYGKLLCIAFDLAVLKAHGGRGFPQFVFHDGVFESLDDRKKTNLLSVMRSYADDGIQQIVTLIDSDMPPSVDGKPVFRDDEIVLTLHDQGADGRLFMTSSW